MAILIEWPQTLQSPSPNWYVGGIVAKGEDEYDRGDLRAKGNILVALRV